MVAALLPSGSLADHSTPALWSMQQSAFTSKAYLSKKWRRIDAMLMNLAWNRGRKSFIPSHL